MKKLLSIIIIYLLLLTACSKKFLEVLPESTVAAEDFYHTENQFNQAVIGAYAAVRNVLWAESSWTMGEMRSDNTHFEWGIQRGVSVDEKENTDYFLDDASSTWALNKYISCYQGISSVNKILDNIETADFAQTSKDMIIGQSKFLRALFYFELAKYYGGVPLYLKAVNSTDEAFLPRSSLEETYKVVINDLQDAIAKLPGTAFPQTGRVSKGSARMMLGDVYLTRKQYALAETEFRALTQMGYNLLPTYAAVFDLTNRNSIESIFEVQYLQGDLGQSNSIIYNFFPVSADVSKITGVVPSRTTGTIAQMNMPTREMIGTYEPGDQRLEASIWIAQGSGPQGGMIIESLFSPIGYTWPVDKRSYAYIKKYLHPHTLEKNQSDNFPVYRYAETLLSLAEVLTEQGKPGEALTYLNMVRKRAGLAASTQTDQNALRDIIIHERRVELAFENKRWLDLVRTDRAISVMTANGVYLKTLFQIIPANAYTNITKNRYIFPIPIRETIIGKLEQNPGY